MKRSMTLTVVFLLLTMFMPRPALSETTFDLGIKGGVSFARFWVGGPEPVVTRLTENALVRPVLGVFFSINLNKAFAIQPGIYYLTHGGAEEFEDIDNPGDFYKDRVIFNYLHVPVLAKLRLMQNVKATPVVFAGPAVEVLLSAKSKSWLNGVPQEDEDFTSALKRLAFGLDFGLGVEYLLNKVLLVFDVRCALGLSNIAGSEDNILDVKFKTRTFLATVGVGF